MSTPDPDPPLPSQLASPAGADEPFVHPTAVIDPGASLGLGCKVWHFCHVSAGAVLGAGCTLGQNVYIGPGVSVGAGSRIQNNVSVYSGVSLEQDVFIGPSVVFTNVKNPRAFIDQRAAFLTTQVEQGATIGANATIVAGVRLGKHCLVGAGAVVTRDVPERGMVVGNPARLVGFVDEWGQCAAPESRRAGLVRMLDPAAENAPFMAELEDAAARVLRSGDYVLGPAVAEFERACAAFFDVPHAIGVSSGSDALLIALCAAGVGPGDEVITSAFSFVSAVEAILRLGAVPKFVDIRPDDYHLDLDQVSAAITEKTKALVPVHLFGRAVDMRSIRAELCARGVAIIEDAAQAWGAVGDEGWVGRAGSATCFSFFPSKNLGGFGDGGLITTFDDGLFAAALQLRNHGARQKYLHERLGGNFRLDALQAALLAIKLPKVHGLLAQRRAHAQNYLQLLSMVEWDHAELTLPTQGPWGHTFNQFVIATDRRDALREHLQARGIESAVHYPTPLHLQPLLGPAMGKPGALPNSEAAARRVLALPVHPALTNHEVQRVCEEIVRFFGYTIPWCKPALR